MCVTFENIISRDNILIEIETFCENFAIIVAAHFSLLKGRQTLSRVTSCVKDPLMMLNLYQKVNMILLFTVIISSNTLIPIECYLCVYIVSYSKG